MENADMLMAPGGMVITIAMLLLLLLVLILIWRTMGSASEANRKLDQLALQVDELFQLMQRDVTSSERPTTAAATARESKDAFGLMDGGSYAGEEAEDSFQLADEQDMSPAAASDESQNEDFDFPAGDDDVFAGFATEALQEAGERTFGEPDEGLAEASQDDSGEAFDTRYDDEEMTAAAGPFAETSQADIKLDAEEERLADQIFGGGASGEDFGDSPAAGEPAGKGNAFFDGEEGAAKQEESAADQEVPDEKAAAAAEPAEERPAIIQLPGDPSRPEVSMARCGTCDHKLAYRKSLAGRKARCPSCKGAFVLP